MKFKNSLLRISLFFFLLSAYSAYAYLHPAELRIKNTSQRHLTVKVMKQTHGNRGKKYTTVFISKQSNKTISINETGNYYLKTKAVISGKAPVYKKGDPFKVYVGRDGYSVLTITFSIRESSLPNLLSGKQISKSDFDNDSD